MANAVESSTDLLERVTTSEYKYGFSVDIEADEAPIGLTEDTIRFISAKKQEPEWLLEWRLKAYARWQQMAEPTWPNVHYPKSTTRILFTTRPQSRKR